MISKRNSKASAAVPAPATTQARPRARDRERTRDKILKAARRSFATRGYAQSADA